MDRTVGDQARRTLEGLITARRFPGIQYIVVDAEGICFEFNGGLADIGARRPVSEQTTFMAASSTKVFTAAAVLQLVQQGKVALDAPLSDYYPHHPYGDQVTVRRLINQSAGIPNPLPLRWLHAAEAHAAFDEEAALQAALRRSPKLAFAPGAQFGYSNLSYWLLGKVIEQASGQSYCAYLRGHLFAPLGLTPAELDCAIPDPAHHAAGYQKKYSPLGLFLYLMMDRRLLAGSEAGRFKLRPVYMNGPAYGGLNATARGLARFLQDQLRPTPRLLDLPTRDLFFTPQQDSQGRGLGTTLGWHRGQMGDIAYFAKPGGGPGFHSNLRVYPAHGLATAWLVNETAVDERPIHRLSDLLDAPFLEGNRPPRP